MPVRCPEAQQYRVTGCTLGRRWSIHASSGSECLGRVLMIIKTYLLSDDERETHRVPGQLWHIEIGCCNHFPFELCLHIFLHLKLAFYDTPAGCRAILCNWSNYCHHYDLLLSALRSDTPQWLSTRLVTPVNASMYGYSHIPHRLPRTSPLTRTRHGWV